MRYGITAVAALALLGLGACSDMGGLGGAPEGQAGGQTGGQTGGQGSGQGSGATAGGTGAPDGSSASGSSAPASRSTGQAASPANNRTEAMSRRGNPASSTYPGSLSGESWRPLDSDAPGAN